jgi:hypothetical protein
MGRIDMTSRTQGDFFAVAAAGLVIDISQFSRETLFRPWRQ